MASNRRARLGLRANAWGVLFGLAALVAIICALGTATQSWRSFHYRSAPTVTVTVASGTSCTVTIARGGSSGTTCPATWQVDGRTVHGTLTTHEGGRLPEKETIQARVYGETARSDLNDREYYVGLWAPLGLIIALPLALVARHIGNRRVAQRATEQLDEDDPTRFGLDPANLTDPAKPPDLSLEVKAAAIEHDLGSPVYAYRPTPPIVFPVVVLLVLGTLIWFFNALPVRIILGIMALIVLALWIGMIVVARGMKDTTMIFSDGFYDRKEDRTFVARWDQLRTVVADQRPGDDHQSTYAVESDEGRSWSLDGAAAEEIGHRLVRDANRARWPDFLRRYEKGEELTFGPLIVGRRGLRIGDNTVGWEHVRDIAYEDDQVALRLGSEIINLPLAQIPWFPIVVRLAQHAREH